VAQPLHRQDLLPDDAVVDVRLPRPRAGSSPRTAAVMLLAELGLSPRAWFPSALLVALVSDLGTTPGGARAVVQRLSRGGVLEVRRDGRETAYRLTVPAADALARGGRLLATFARDAEDWDGRWSLVAFSAPKHADSERAVLRSRLRWRGYVPLYDGLWVAPDLPGDALAPVLAEARRTSVTVFRAEQLEVDGAAVLDPAVLWDLDAVRERHEVFLDEWVPVGERVADGTLTGEDALRARTRIADEYRRFVVLDPRLPMGAMPPGWLRPRVRDVFAAVHDGTGEPVLAHVRAVAAARGVAVPDLRVHTTAELAAGGVTTEPVTVGGHAR
jgi:phenylacetic acid degradation operon negative regulatory protein